jgi:threonine synthase
LDRAARRQSGQCFAAFGKALREMHGLGFIARLPRLAVIQAEGAAPFYDHAGKGRAAFTR